MADELDALAAAPANHELLLANEEVRLLQSVAPVAAMTPVHTHRWVCVEYALSTTDFMRRDRDGNVLLDTRVANGRPRTSDVLWSEPLPTHSVENVGDMLGSNDRADRRYRTCSGS
jgi:hypothetical protein